MWIADDAATFHMTGNGEGLYDCYPPPPEMGLVVVGNTRTLLIRCFGKIDMVMQSRNDDKIPLVGVAFVPGL